MEKSETLRNEVLQKAGNLKSSLEISEILRNEINPTEKSETLRNEMLQKAGNLESNLEKSKTFRNEMFKIWKFEIRLEMQLKAGQAEIINFQKNL